MKAIIKQLTVALVLLTALFFADIAGARITSTDAIMANEQKATFGAGCFWCVEAIFSRVDGVTSVVSGYSGGRKDEASYRVVKTGETGHAEAVQITYNPELVSYDALLEIFWRTHDPTTLNRQGADVGPQYRSVVFYHNDHQRERAEYYKGKLDESDIFDDPIVTEITPFDAFYQAEDYHQNFFANNPDQGYCQVVIRPKIDKFKSLFRDKLREEYRP
ncbi:peptide-methionine (S)-S-oxide reductase MsrA [Balneolales bacterium ANBcel1]|nr:peptide-methionine (S)-S-oxide reductase MsrA [Balneolales bacterium ANBcel1]